MTTRREREYIDLRRRRLDAHLAREAGRRAPPWRPGGASPPAQLDLPGTSPGTIAAPERIRRR